MYEDCWEIEFARRASQRLRTFFAPADDRLPCLLEERLACLRQSEQGEERRGKTNDEHRRSEYFGCLQFKWPSPPDAPKPP
jgi:hypothetical protein